MNSTYYLVFTTNVLPNTQHYKPHHKKSRTNCVPNYRRIKPNASCCSKANNGNVKYYQCNNFLNIQRFLLISTSFRCFRINEGVKRKIVNSPANLKNKTILIPKKTMAEITAGQSAIDPVIRMKGSVRNWLYPSTPNPLKPIQNIRHSRNSWQLK